MKKEVVMRRTKYSLQSIMEDIGHALAELRLRMGYDSIKEFTSDFGLPMIQYWRIEKGKANLTLKSLHRLLAIHKIGIGEFFCYLNKWDTKNS